MAGICPKHLKVNLRGNLADFWGPTLSLARTLARFREAQDCSQWTASGHFLRRKRFEPSFALGLALKPSQVKQSVEIDQEEFVKYVAGETVQLAESLPNGWYQVLVQGNGLGFAKVTGNV